MNERSDIMHGDGLYEGTLWQYRWFVPWDVDGMAEMVGGKDVLAEELAYFFEEELYNHGNQPDIQAPFLFNQLEKPELTQKWVHRILTQPMNQHYGTHSKWEKPYFGRIYKNQPDAYIPEMDDDAGTMSGWFVLASLGLYPRCVGMPVYELSTPLFSKAQLNLENPFIITTEGEGPYIQKVILNGEEIDRFYIRHEEIVQGGSLHYELASEPI